MAYQSEQKWNQRAFKRLGDALAYIRKAERCDDTEAQRLLHSAICDNKIQTKYEQNPAPLLAGMMSIELPMAPYLEARNTGIDFEAGSIDGREVVVRWDDIERVWSPPMTIGTPEMPAKAEPAVISEVSDVVVTSDNSTDLTKSNISSPLREILNTNRIKRQRPTRSRGAYYHDILILLNSLKAHAPASLRKSVREIEKDVRKQWPKRSFKSKLPTSSSSLRKAITVALAETVNQSK